MYLIVRRPRVEDDAVSDGDAGEVSGQAFGYVRLHDGNWWVVRYQSKHASGPSVACCAGLFPCFLTLT